MPNCQARASCFYKLSLLCAGLIMLLVLATASGYIPISLSDLLKILTGPLLPNKNLDPILSGIIWEIRLPRILASILVGGGLALAGGVFQGILLNPLADPYTLGVSAGAAFGACLTLSFDCSAVIVSLAAFTGAIISLAIVLLLAGFKSTSLNNLSLILAGIIVSAILSAGISFFKYMAGDKVAVMVFWLMGSFAARTWVQVGTLFILLACGSVICLYYARDLNLLAFGHKAATSLGVNSRHTTLTLLVTASFVSAACVAISGIIGFVGLLVPHLLRFWLGPDNRLLLPACLPAGGLLLLAADTLTRVVLPTEVPIGVLTALVGGPVFCIFLMKRLRNT